jgi:glycosyltransferase involved in cell wall biosynthesis
MDAAVTPPIDIIIVNDFAHINGGAAKVALHSALALARTGWHVTVFSAVQPVMAELTGNAIKLICTGQEEILTDTNRLRAARQGIWNSQAAARMGRLLESCDPSRTIVHLHGWTKSLSASIIGEAVKRKFPVVCTLHDYFIACPNGGFFNYRTGEICRLRALSPACIATNCDKKGYPQKLWRLGRQIVQQTAGHTPSGIGHFITISSFSRNILAPYLPPDAQLHYVPNPIFAAKDTPADVAHNESFIAVGRLSTEKGVLLFADAASRAGMSSTFIGDGECRGALEKKYPDATITGWQTEAEVTAHLRQARALVLPSLWYETQGMVVLEAAAQGVPAIVPDSSAARDGVVDGQTGLWFRGGDAVDLAEKITMLKDRALAARLGQAAYDRFWADPPTMEKHLARLQQVYGRMLQPQVTPQPAMVESTKRQEK